MSIEKFNYKNLDIEINSDIKERVIQHNIEGYKTIIFSSRGIRAHFFSKFSDDVFLFKISNGAKIKMK